jgi:hypothetical protein
MPTKICAVLLIVANFAVESSVLSAQRNVISNQPDLILVLEPSVHAYGDVVREASNGIPILFAVPDWKSLSDRLKALAFGAETGQLDSIQETMTDIAGILTRAGVDLDRLRTYREVLVISPRPVPIDLLGVAGEPLGRRVIFEHYIVTEVEELRAGLSKYIGEHRELLRRVGLLAIAPMPRGIPRQNQDIVKAALKLSAIVPVDIVIEPSDRESVRYFSRDDVSILHLDTHGSENAVELSTNEQHLYRANDLPSRTGPRLILLVGCSTGAGAESLAPSLVKQGADAVIGMPFVFRSGDPSGGDITNPLFYDTLWNGIVEGRPVGEALLRAKQTMPINDWSVMWLLFGNADLRFDIEHSP